MPGRKQDLHKSNYCVCRSRLLSVMKSISKVATMLFLVCAITVSGIPAFASASDPSGPTIYFAKEIHVGDELVVYGVGFTPSSTITLACDGTPLQTIPSPLVTNSSGAFNAIVLTHALPDVICTLTATDGKMTSQSPLIVKITDHDKPPPNPPICDGNTPNAPLQCCATESANQGPFTGC